MAAEVQRPEAPILGVEERKDVKAFYTNAAYRTSRAAINVEKMKILKDRLAECVRTEGANFVDRCEQLSKRYEASVRVAQLAEGNAQRARNVGNILEREKGIKAELQAEGA